VRYSCCQPVLAAEAGATRSSELGVSTAIRNPPVLGPSNYGGVIVGRRLRGGKGFRPFVGGQRECVRCSPARRSRDVPSQPPAFPGKECRLSGLCGLRGAFRVWQRSWRFLSCSLDSTGNVFSVRSTCVENPQCSGTADRIGFHP
jgi:hypothetical protein